MADRAAPAVERAQLLEKVRAGRERQQALSRRLLTAQEEERRRLAVELHDELGQLLTAVKINLESLARSRAAPAPAHLRDAIGSVDHALQRVRDLALDLRPSVLDDLGLPVALRWYVDRFARDAHVEAHVSIDAVPYLPPELETACFRVAQEALTNVARHAQARNVWLELHLLAGRRARADGLRRRDRVRRRRRPRARDRRSLDGPARDARACFARGWRVRAVDPGRRRHGGACTLPPRALRPRASHDDPHSRPHRR